MKQVKFLPFALLIAAALPSLAQEMDHSQMDHSKMDHSKMDHSKMDHAAPPMTTDDQPLTPLPPLTAADRAAAVAPSMHMQHLDNAINSYSLLNRLESWDANPGTGLAWEAQGWIGTDTDRLWWRSEGELSGGHTEAANLQLLYGHSFSRWWDWVAGVRHDFKPGKSQSFATFGVQGLAPQKFEVSAMASLGERGQTALDLEVEYELPFSGRLILQPLAEASFHGKDDPAHGIGSGFSTLEAGLRLRYEFTRKFAPYVGLVHERSFGNTADLRRQAGEHAEDTRFVVGLRTWF